MREFKRGVGRQAPEVSLGDASEDALLEQGQLAALAKGDEAAFWSLWERHQHRLFMVCLQQMDGNHAEAEDALGQIMLKARERLPLYAKRIATLRPWLVKLAQNLCIDIQRGRRLRLQAPRQLEALIEAEQSLNGLASESPETLLLFTESEEEVRRGIRGLPPRLRKPLLLRCFGRMSSQAVAEELCLSPDTVRKRIQLARECLRRNLENISSTTARSLPRVPDSEPGGTHGPADGPDLASPGLQIPAHTVAVRVVNVPLGCGIHREFTVFMDRPSGRESRKVAALRTYLERHPGSWKKRLQLAELLYQTGTWSEAIELWLEVLERRPWRVDLAVKAGSALRLLGRRADAETVLAGGLAQARGEATRRHFSGLLAAHRGKSIEAAAAMRQASEFEPDNPAHKHQLAWICLESNRREEALRVLDCLLKDNPDDLVALTLGHEALLASGLLEVARRRLDHALELAPDNILFLHWMAENSMATGLSSAPKTAQTKRLLRRALRLAPHSFLVQESLGRYHILSGERERGLAFFRAFVANHPFCRRGWHHLARLLRLAGAKSEADAAAARLRALSEKPCAPCVGACALP
jgi:RNA polymerase sigma factor (sigma-70 family)